MLSAFAIRIKLKSERLLLPRRSTQGYKEKTKEKLSVAQNRCLEVRPCILLPRGCARRPMTFLIVRKSPLVSGFNPNEESSAVKRYSLSFLSSRMSNN
jgi:hypothetical protein